MLIPPPNDEEPEPIYDEGPTEFTREQYEYIKERLSHPTWLCPSCGLTNHHYNRSCARCRVEKR